MLSLACLYERYPTTTSTRKLTSTGLPDVAAPRRRYSRIPVGVLETLPAGVSRARSGRELYAELWLRSHRRTLPGVLRAGEGTLADILAWPLPTL
jgi:hypothetical protein